jgi:hypothetical protein
MNLVEQERFLLDLVDDDGALGFFRRGSERLLSQPRRLA